MPVSEPEYRYRRLWYLLAILLLMFIVFASLWPKPPKIFFSIRFSDKLLHFIAYFVLMGWYVQLVRRSVFRLGLLVAFVSLGILLEVLQGMGGVRHFDWYDGLANSVGVVVAFFLARTRFQMLLHWFENRCLNRLES